MTSCANAIARIPAHIVKTTPADAYFLAGYIVGQSAQVLQANEMLALLDLVKPIYDKQPAHVHALALETQSPELPRSRRPVRRCHGLAQAACNRLPATTPCSSSTHRRWPAQAYSAAYAWLNRVLGKGAKWLYWEEDHLHGAYTEFLQQQGRQDDLVKYLADWVARDPSTRASYEQYLSALIRTDQIDKANTLALKWLKDAEVKDELSLSAHYRLAAAVNLMLGNGHGSSSHRVDERWQKPLADAAIYFARNDVQLAIAEAIVRNNAFDRTEEAPHVRHQLVETLVADQTKLSAAQVRHMVGLLRSSDADPATWRKLADALRQRWAKEVNDADKHRLGPAIVTILGWQSDAADLLGFLRLQMGTGPANHRGNAHSLFDTLLGQPWSADFESKALGLLDKLSDAEQPRALAGIGHRPLPLHRPDARESHRRRHIRAKRVQRQPALQVPLGTRDFVAV